MTSIRRRLLANAGATTFGKAIASLIQVISVPILLHQWGTALYGEWLLLSAIPTYLSMSDIGFGSVAANEMTMLVAAGKRDDALDAFQSVSLFITIISAALTVLLTITIWTLPIERWLRIHILSVHDARLILLLLAVSTLLTLQEGLLQGSFRCVGRYAMGMMAKSVVLACSFLGLVAAALLGANPVQVAIVIVLINGVGTLALWLLLRRQIDWLRYGIRHAHWSTVRRLALPAVSFMSFPVSTVLNTQGILIVVGHIIGPVGVVTFSTARTISRTAYQVIQIINSSVWPEISAAFGAGSLTLVRKLHRKSCQMSIFSCISISLVIVIFGDRVWGAWTLGKIHTDPILLDLFLVQLLIAAFWYTSSVVPVAVNKHEGVARVVLIASVMSLVISVPLMSIERLGLRGAAIALIVGDAFTTAFVLRTSLRIAEDNLGKFSRSLFEVPAVLYRKIL